jgi:hypothetical protein
MSGSGRTLARRILYPIKHTDASINGILHALNLILRLISDPNCLPRNLTSLGLPTFDAASYVFQTFPYLFTDSGCE